MLKQLTRCIVKMLCFYLHITRKHMKTRLLISFILFLIFALPASAQDDDGENDIELAEDYAVTVEVDGYPYFMSSGYPQDWTVIEATYMPTPEMARMTLSNNPDVLDVFPPEPLESGDIMVNITGIALSEFFADDIPFSITVEDVAQHQLYLADIVLPIDVIDVAGRDVAVYEPDDTDFDRRVYVMLFENVVVFVDSFTFIGELDQYNNHVHAIVGSVDAMVDEAFIRTIDLPNTISIDDGFGGTLRVDYPDGWFIYDERPRSVSIFNVVMAEDYADWYFYPWGYPFSIGQLGLTIDVHSYETEYMASFFDDGAVPTLDEILEAMLRFSIMGGSPYYYLDDIEIMELSDIRIAQTTLSSDVNDDFRFAEYMLLEIETGVVLISVGYALDDGREGWQTLLNSILLSIEYTAP